MVTLNALCKAIAAGFVGLSLLAMPVSRSVADDTELFTQPPGQPQPAPNVLVVIDSSANWNAGNQHWASGKQGAAELQQLAAVTGQLSGKKVALGLILMTNGGGYVRIAPRDLSVPANATAIVNEVTAIYNGNFVMGGIGSNDQVPTSQADYSDIMYEVYNYFSGAAAYLGATPALRDYTGNATTYSSPYYGLTSGNAFTSSGATTYSSPLNSVVPCAKNYVIFIGNGLPNHDSGMGGGDSTSTIKALNGGVAPSVISISGYPAAQANWMDEWSKFLYSHGAAAPSGVSGTIVTYTIDVYKDAQDKNQTALFKSAARVGGGKYFAATNDNEIATAFNQIFTEIQSVSSVFASATLPVSVNVRGTNLNQIYLGVFRPDADALPNWPGNLKEYKLGTDGSGNLILVDSTGMAALSASTGFFTQSSVSYWTSANTYWSFNADPNALNPNSDSADGPFVERGAANEVLRVDSANPATKKLAADRKVYTYVGTSPAIGSPVTLSSSNNYAFTTANTTNLTPSMFGVALAADMNNAIDWVRGADLNDEDGKGDTTDLRPRAHGDVIHSRPAVINYNRYGDENDVAIYYGSNDGLLHALQGGQQYSLASVNGRSSTAPSGGAEYWAFAAPEFFPNYPRQYNNSPTISWSTTPSAFTANGFSSSGATTISTYNINNNIASSQTVSGSGIAAGTTVSSISNVHGFLASAAATATASGLALKLQPPGEQSAPMIDVKLTNGSPNATFASGYAPPSWLAPGMTLSGTGIPAGSTVSSLVTQSGASLSVPATSNNTAASYTFSTNSGGSTTLVSDLATQSGSTTAYILSTAGSAVSSVSSQVYSSSNTGSTIGSAIPAGSTISNPSVSTVGLSYMAGNPTGTAGSVDSGLTFTLENLLAGVGGKTANSSQTCAAGATCAIGMFSLSNFSSAPLAGDILSGSCSGLTIVSGSTTSSLNVLNLGSSCTIANKTSITYYPAYVLTNMLQAAGQPKVAQVASGTIKRGGVTATLPAATLTVVSVTGTSSTGLPTSAIVTPTTVPTETLSVAASTSASGNAAYSSTGTLTPVAICTGNTATGSSSITGLSACSMGSTSLIVAGQVVQGLGIPSSPGYTTTFGIVNPGFIMSASATATSASSGQAVTAYIPWTANTVQGSFTVQVSNPTDLSGVPNGWTVVGAGIPLLTTVTDNAIGSVQFVTLSTATTGALTTGSTGTSLTFTNPSAGSSSTGPKPYFFDGPIGTYRYDAPNTGTGATATTGDGKIIAGSCNTSNSSDCDQAIIFVPMRRGGRMLYAFDVTDPASPKLLWKKGCTSSTGTASCDAGFEELGQTFSLPQPVNMNINGTTKSVIIMGGGYDPSNDDQDPSLNMSNRSMGRAVYFIEAKTGTLIKVFKGSSASTNALGGTTEMGIAQTLSAANMNCSIPSDVAALTKDPSTGLTLNVFRVYVGDTCGQVWRLDTSDASPDNWIVTKLASVGQAYYRSSAGGSLTGDSLAAQSRKFLFSPDVVYQGTDSHGSFHYVLMGSGDREHPFNGYGDTYHPSSQGVVNRFYMFKDYNVGTSYTAKTTAPNPLTLPPAVYPLNSTGTASATPVSGSGTLPYYEPYLYDATADLVQLGTPGATGSATIAASNLDRYNGWYITLGTAEKTVGGATSSAGYVYFGTNQPLTTSNVCSSNLGTARLYQVNIATAGAAPPSITNGVVGAVTSTTQRYEPVAGGGLPPTPVPVAVVINGKFVEGIIAGTKISTPATSIVGSRIRTYNSKLIDKK